MPLIVFFFFLIILTGLIEISMLPKSTLKYMELQNSSSKYYLCVLPLFRRSHILLYEKCIHYGKVELHFFEWYCIWIYWFRKCVLSISAETSMQRFWSTLRGCVKEQAWHLTHVSLIKPPEGTCMCWLCSFNEKCSVEKSAHRIRFTGII